MKKLLVIILGFAMLQTAAIADDDKPITFSQLPKKAQMFVETHFSKDNISYAKLERDFFSKEYSVILTNGDKIDFDKNGEWFDIKCEKTAVPMAIVPSAIQTHVNQNYNGAKIIKIDRQQRNYEVKLSNGRELIFNKKGEFLRFD